jgi:hypothetical protein
MINAARRSQSVIGVSPGDQRGGLREDSDNNNHNGRKPETEHNDTPNTYGEVDFPEGYPTTDDVRSRIESF